MDAHITITGNVGTDVELFGGGSQEWTYANFRLACTRRYLRSGTWQDSPTVWITVTCKNRVLAENVKASLTKGDAVVVTGRLASSSFTKEGQTIDKLVIEAVSVGHDLSRGVTSFRRVERNQTEPTTEEGEADPGRIADQGSGEPSEQLVGSAA